MKKIWIVYREYYDWDTHAKDNVRAFETEAQAVLFKENANFLHTKWRKMRDRCWSKRRQSDKLLDLINEESEIKTLNLLYDIMPEYKNNNCVDHRFEYSIETLKMENP